MASMQLTLKDNSSITRLKRQGQQSSLASLTQLLRQPGLTIKKTIPANVEILNIDERTGQKRVVNNTDEKKTANNVCEKKTANNLSEKRTTNNLSEKRTANNLSEKRTANKIDEIKNINMDGQNIRNRRTFSNIDPTKSLSDVLRKKTTMPKLGTTYTIKNKKTRTNKGNATLKQINKEQNNMKMSSEFYPEKMKRNISLKKIFLKPKHEYKIIGTTNKRKRCMPVRDITSTKRLKPSSPITNVHDDLLLNDELNDEMMINNELTDEDLMEILTCESPVWWEELPEGLNEEPIGRESPLSSNTSLFLKENSPQSSKTTQSFTRNTDTCQNQKIKEKQNKLERLLNNLKEMKVKHKENETKSLIENGVTEKEGKSRKHSTDSSDISICDDDLIKCLESVEIPIKTNNLYDDELKKNIMSQNLGECNDPGENLAKNKVNLKNNAKTKNNKKGTLVKKDTKIPIIEIKHDAVVEKSSRISDISILKIPIVEINDDAVEEKLEYSEIKKSKEKEILIKNIKIPVDPVEDNSSNNKMNLVDNEITKSYKKYLFVNKDAELPILHIKKNTVVENDSNNKNNINLVDNKLKNENVILIKKNKKVQNVEMKEISIRRPAKVPNLDIKDCATEESIRNKNNDKKEDTPKITLEKSSCAKKDTITPIPNLRNDDFKSAMLKKLIVNEILSTDDKIVEIKTDVISRNDKIKKLGIEKDPIENIPIFCINKNETTSCEVQDEEPTENVVKKRKKIIIKNTDAQNHETHKKDRENSIPLDQVDQNHFKKDTQEAIILLNNDKSKTKKCLETQEEIPSTSKLNETINLHNQIETVENIQNPSINITLTRKSPRKNSKKSSKKINITKKYPNILREDRNRLYARKIQSQNSNDSNKIIQSDDENSNKNKQRLSLIRQHYLEILKKRTEELSNLTPNNNSKNKSKINNETSITVNNIESNNDFCIQNTKIKFDNKIKCYTNTNQIESSKHVENIKTYSRININSTNCITDTDTNDSEQSINADSINSNNNINSDSINCNNNINSDSINCNNNINSDSINCNNSIKNNNEIPLNLPKLTKIPDVASPISIKSMNSDSTDDNYTISDSNVTYIDEYEGRDKNDELVTVYKILSRPDKTDKNQYLNVPGVNMKYCYNCSTIFDTENCLYCFKNSIHHSET